MQAITKTTSASSLYGSSSCESPVKQFCRVLDRRKLRFVESDDAVREALNLTLVIKISLVDSEQDCWRRVQVPAAIKLSTLHDQVIVPVMGWSRGYHGYVFYDPKDGAVLGPAKYGGYIDMMHADMKYHYVMDDREVPLAALVKARGDTCYYTYDLGDDWEHSITVEKVLETKGKSKVILLDGKGACPPEDSNGLEGKGCCSYAEFLDTYKKNPKKPHVKQTVKEVEQTAMNYASPWMGPPIKFKPLEFNLGRHRRMLEAMLAGPTIKKKSYWDGQDGFMESMKGCAVCGDRIKALKRCSRCQKVWYCSRECQLSDWKAHKSACKKAKNEAVN